MTKDDALKIARAQGRAAAQALQESSYSMTGTEINAADKQIPWFSESVKRVNMLYRKAGDKDGFICKSSAGRVVRLIQVYDSDIFTAEPEELSAQWRFVWSTDPDKALPFIALATSPYSIGECCLDSNGNPKVSNINNNVFHPNDAPQYWDDPIYS